MNKKRLVSAVFGVAALGAGAFALTSLGGDDSSSQLPSAPMVHASDDQSHYEPYSFVSEGGFFAAGSKSREITAEGRASADPVADDTPNVPQAPNPGGSIDTPNPETPNSDGNPAGPDVDESEDMPSDAPGQPDPAPKPPIIWNPDVIDAICEVLGCGDPVIPLDPDLADDFCELLNCDREPHPINSPVQGCELLGNCPPINPGKVIQIGRRL